MHLSFAALQGYLLSFTSHHIHLLHPPHPLHGF
ncbi:hypothetical protein CJF32_00008373 [Rutstroemia sp. NJR-2017a WRK4]|nr:hypothetical protein CJF32_00008373 [Rutstroemia sp. NJR-2017a WRK4]